MTQLFDTEETPEGTQTLIPGVSPLDERARMAQRQAQPLAGGQRPCDIGLFDEATEQLDMLDLMG